MNKISKAVVSRLPRYYRYLDELKAQKHRKNLVKRAKSDDECYSISD